MPLPHPNLADFSFIWHGGRGLYTDLRLTDIGLAPAPRLGV